MMLDVSGRRVLVVGGGPVALRRVTKLVRSGARVDVVAPRTVPELDALAVTIARRPFDEADVVGAWLVFACTDDPMVNAVVAASAEANGCFCVRSDAAPGGTARMAATVVRDDLTVSVNGGRRPAPGFGRARRDRPRARSRATAHPARAPVG